MKGLENRGRPPHAGGVTLFRRVAIAGAGVAAVAVLLVAAITLGRRLGAVPWPGARVPSDQSTLQVGTEFGGSPAHRRPTFGAPGAAPGGGSPLVTPVIGAGGLTLAATPRPPSTGPRAVSPPPSHRVGGRTRSTVGPAVPGPAVRTPAPGHAAPAPVSQVAAPATPTPTTTPTPATAPAAGSAPAPSEPVPQVASKHAPSVADVATTNGHGHKGGSKDQGANDNSSKPGKDSSGKAAKDSSGKAGKDISNKPAEDSAESPAAAPSTPDGGGHGSHGDGGGQPAAGGHGHHGEASAGTGDDGPSGSQDGSDGASPAGAEAGAGSVADDAAQQVGHGHSHGHGRHGD